LEAKQAGGGRFARPQIIARQRPRLMKCSADATTEKYGSEMLLVARANGRSRSGMGILRAHSRHVSPAQETMRRVSVGRPQNDIGGALLHECARAATKTFPGGLNKTKRNVKP
jgi:hypothetical protein